jgi:hypothetical protein
MLAATGPVLGFQRFATQAEFVIMTISTMFEGRAVVWLVSRPLPAWPESATSVSWLLQAFTVLDSYTAESLQRSLDGPLKYAVSDLGDEPDDANRPAWGLQRWLLRGSPSPRESPRGRNPECEALLPELAELLGRLTTRVGGHARERLDRVARIAAKYSVE